MVNAALNLISYNKERFDKKIKAFHKSEQNVEFALFKTQREENLRIIRDIAERIEHGGNYINCFKSRFYQV